MGSRNYVGGRLMDRWDALFAELESETHTNAVLDLHANAQELAKAELSQQRIADVLGASVGVQVTVSLRSGLRLSGEILGTSQAWLTLRIAQGIAIMPTVHIAAVAGLPQKARSLHAVSLSGEQGEATSGKNAQVGTLSFEALMRRLQDRRLRMRFVVGPIEIIGVLRGVARDHFLVDQVAEAINDPLVSANRAVVGVAVLSQHVEVVYC